MSEWSLGLRHYLLILLPSLIDDLQDYGLSDAASDSRLHPHDVEKAFFTARAMADRLPEIPEQAPPERWPEIMIAIHGISAVLDVLEKETFDAVAAQALATTAEVARDRVKREFERKRAGGEVDFRLHGLSTTEPTGDGPDPAVEASFAIQRGGRYDELMATDTERLKAAESVILDDAKALARGIVEGGSDDTRLDALLAMATLVRETTGVRFKSNLPDAIRERFDCMAVKATMALGAIVYRDEYQQLKASLDLPPLELEI